MNCFSPCNLSFAIYLYNDGKYVFWLVPASKPKFFTRVAILSFISHSCHTRVICAALPSLVSHWCCTRAHLCRSCPTRVTRVWFSFQGQDFNKNSETATHRWSAEELFQKMLIIAIKTVIVVILLLPKPDQKISISSLISINNQSEIWLNVYLI